MTNKYGLDTHYFKKNLQKIVDEIDNYTPDEMCRALKRLSDSARANRKEAVLKYDFAESK